MNLSGKISIVFKVMMKIWPFPSEMDDPSDSVTIYFSRECEV